MAQKKITDLQLRDEVSDTVNFPGDDGIQTYRMTAEQLKNYVLASENVTRDAIAASERVPTGVQLPFAGTVAPTGYLFCDGAAVSRSTYAALFAVIGVTHGEGNGSSTFNLPDWRGRFMRFVDGGIGRDPNRATRTAMNTGGNTGDNVGSVQGQATAKNGLSATTNNDTHGHSVDVQTSGATGSSGAIGTSGQAASSTRSTTSDTHNHTVTVSSSDSETRPLNAYSNIIIKF